MNTTALYTAIFGGRDVYREPKVSDCDLILFSDVPVKTERARVVLVPEVQGADPRRTARMYKLLPQLFLPMYDATIWVDGCFDVTRTDVSELVSSALSSADICAFKSRFRDCAYSEGQWLILHRWDAVSKIVRQLDRCRKAGFPESAGLAETGVLIRRNNTEKMNRFNAAWWGELADGTVRDQVSFNYTVWKERAALTYLPGGWGEYGFNLQAHCDLGGKAS